MENLEFSQIVGFIAVLLAIMNFYLLVDKVRLAHRAETAHRNEPVRSVQDRMDAYDKKLEEMDRKLQDLEKEYAKHGTENNLILRGLFALTRHAIDGNNVEGLKAYLSELQNYVIDK